jgi:hypothetical protein
MLETLDLAELIRKLINEEVEMPKEPISCEESECI